jgi:uncharacterized protein (TIGR03643 family)
MKDLDDATISDIIAMAWADDVSFDAIEIAHGLKEKEVKALMRSNLKSGSYKVWRARVNGRKAKHAGKMRPRSNESSNSWKMGIWE